MTLKSEYQKQRRRIQSLIRRYTNLGIDVEYTIPKIPKRITKKSISRLSKITAKTIQSKSFVPDFETGLRKKLTTYLKGGKTLSSIGKAYRSLTTTANIPTIPAPSTITVELEPKQTLVDIVPNFNDVIINNFKELISLFPEDVQEIMNKWLENVSQKMTPSELADFLEEANSQGLWPTFNEAYNMQKIYDNINRMTELLELSGGEKNQILTALDAEDIWEGELYL